MKKMKKIWLVLTIVAASTMYAQKESEYVREGKQVKVTHYYDDGSIRETGQYTKNKADGKWQQFDREGNLVMEAFYDMGVKDGKWYVWKDDGNTLYELIYANNRLLDSHKWKIEERSLLVDR